MCSLEFILNNLSEQDIAALYQEEKYFDSEYAGGAECSYEQNKDEQYKKAEHALNFIARYKKAGKLLDVGCAGGYFVEYAKRQYNYDAKGVEPSPVMVRLARARGHDVCEGGVFDVPKSWGSFDVVYLGDMLEHVKNPHPIIAEVLRRLSDNGLIAIEVPLTYNITIAGLVIGIASMLRGRFGYKHFLPAQHRTKLMPKPPYHLLMFGPKSITRLLRKHGFEVRLVRVFEGKPKDKFRNPIYRALKFVGYFITNFIPQKYFGDRMIAIAQKK